MELELADGELRCGDRGRRIKPAAAAHGMCAACRSYEADPPGYEAWTGRWEN
ncbi:hypothetical protein [Kitasatospora sp. GP82]|uniref:hypothetical protein n=1 Tax=Kitasatospora sp. GP82 TaxID=3035089 RepID=UPI002476A9C9|nr:hypothetical protein [Kitasatospora sp. GP82]MDH6130236.1 hypothetical protein [Kitasatospora sp. GP82]